MSLDKKGGGGGSASFVPRTTPQTREGTLYLTISTSSIWVTALTFFFVGGVGCGEGP